jgi:3-hydroxyacyl-[acyl-carrier-protein] dehydratase
MTSAYANIIASPLAGCLSDLLVDRDNAAVTAQLCCAPDFPGFAGHFPGQPVLPAVLQLLAVRLLAESAVGAPLSPVGVERLKFKGMVAPGETIDLRVSLHDHAELLKGEFSLVRAGAAIASGTLLFRRVGGEG